METFLKAVLLSAALVLSGSAQAAKNILIFGDSLSAGYGIAREDAWASLLQQDLQRHHPQFEVINASISGETTAGGLRRIGPALRQHRPAIVIIELGANDGLRGIAIAETERNLDMLIKQVKESHARLLLLGMRLPPNYGPEYTRRFHAMYAALASKHDIRLLPFMLDGVPPDQFQPDNLHPTAAAQPHIMHNILRSLTPLLRP